MSRLYDTSDVARQNRFAYWREAVCEAYVQLGCEGGDLEHFHGGIDVEHYPNLSISNVYGTAHEVHRRKRDIARSTDEYFLLSLQMNEVSFVAQHGNIARLEPGDLALYSSTDPYQLTLTDDFHQMVVQLPKTRLLERLPNADLLTGKRIRGASDIGRLVSDNIVSFSRLISDGGDRVQSLVQDVLIDLIATGLASLDDGGVEMSLPEQHIMLRARTFIHANLADPHLDRNAVAVAVGMSVRRLNELFAKEGSSVAGFIRKARLDRTAQDFSDPRFTGQSISEIAMKWGFNNFQHFSKLFRAHFGVSPTEYRMLQASGAHLPH
ncbi:helix-turn-helix domain-containing protein [Hoeflea sp. TYP-13]|uniref:helix-turn-helix domain-containing protein n=1 Tax=Hoeflea sp. TYP-13 TaxID=3230023 RepID=UPI0034C6BBC8